MNNSSSSNRLPAVLLLALAVFGPPSAAVLTFAHAVTQNPWLTACLVLLYEVIVLIVSIISKIWQRLEGHWIEQIAGWLDIRMRSILSRYQRNYCEYLIYQHRDFDVKGLSTQGIYTLDLKQVFVQLGIVPIPAHQASTDPLKVPEALRTGGHSIWDYLASETLGNQHLVIIGAPGSGKTTLLKHMTLTLVDSKKRNQQYKVPYKLPILLFIRDHVHAIKENTNLTLVDIVQAHLKKWKRPAPVGWVEQRLRRGGFLVLLDGLDEVADSEVRRQIIDWVQQQMIAYCKNRFILTSRPFGYRSNLLSGVTVLEVRPFTPEQVKLFVDNWYVANEIMSSQRNDPGVRMRAKREAGDLLRRLHDTPALYSLAINPLLLTMIATVHRYRSTLPGKRVALYAEICEVFLGKRQEARGLTLELSPEQTRWILQPLAFYLMHKGVREIPLSEAEWVIKKPLEGVNTNMAPKVFLQMVENTSGVLLEREHGVYGFAHLSFQEYLAATYVRENKLENLLVAQVGASWWHETIRLYCAQADATPIIAACLASNRPTITAIALALECQREAFRVDSRVSSQLDALINQGVEDADPEWRHIVAEALLARRLQQMIRLNEEKEVYTDTSLITCAEYQVFLDKQATQGLHHQPDHWTSKHFLLGQGQSPVLGIRHSDAAAFCTWLAEFEFDTWHYRLPTKGELEKKVEELRAQDKFVAGTGYWTYGGEGFAWARKNGLPSNNMLRDTINHFLESDFSRAYKGDYAHDRSLGHTLDLDLDRTFELDLTHSLGIALSRDLDRARARTRTRNFEFASPRDFDHTLISDLPRDFDRNLERIRAFDLARDRVLNLELTRAIARINVLNLDPDHARTIVHDLEVNRTLAVTRDRYHDRALALARDIAKAITRACDRANPLHVNQREVSDFLFWYIRFFTQVLATYLSYVLWDEFTPQTRIQRLFHHTNNRKQGEGEIKRIIDAYLDIFVTFAMFEARIKGILPAWEGLLIMKERGMESH